MTGVNATGNLGLSILRRIELETLYSVGEILSRSLDFRHTVREVLRALDELAGMSRSMVTVLDPESGELVVNAVNGQSESDTSEHLDVRYQPGEGLLGLILEEKRTIAIARTGEDKRFLNRLGIYDRRLPFIAAPISLGGNFQGVLAVQPNTPDDGMLEERTRFVEMVAKLIGQSVRLSLDIAQEKKHLSEERDSLRRKVQHQYGFENIIGRSAPMRRVFDQVRMVSKWNTTVLLRGETGTGKELIASAIHYHSPRSNATYVRLNCASLPENLLESELFGHEKGAFTGAVSARRGRFETANGGTLFLDEIGEISAMFQAKLLRVIQEGEFERVGGSKTIKTDVRLIAATNRNLEEAVAKGDFRADLYYRISVVPLFLPPLRDRPSDIPKLAREFLRRYNDENTTRLSLTDDALQVLTGCYFPGNVRELENCVRRTATLAHGPNLTGRDFACRNDGCLSAMLWQSSTREAVPAGFQPLPIAPQGATRPAAPPSAAEADWPAGCPAPGHCPASAADGKSEKERLVEAMETAGWVQAKAARLMGLTPRQMGYALRKHDIPIKKF